MRLFRLTVGIGVLVPHLLAPARAQAQEPLRVVRHAPVDTVRPGDIVTVTFDRPVRDEMDHLPNPAKIVRLEPRIAARIEWRDPVTLRVIPTEPFAPSRRYSVVVDTSFDADDGGRLESPYRFTLVTRGPRLLAQHPSGNAFGSHLPTAGRVTLLYSASIDTAELSRVARLEVHARGEADCRATTIRFRVRSERAYADTDIALKNATHWSGDVDSRFRRVVELQSEGPLPEGCAADWVLPSFDPGDRPEVRRGATTMPSFRVSHSACVADDCALGPGFKLAFTAPVRADQGVSRIRLDPKVPYTVTQAPHSAQELFVNLSIRPRTTYRITIDSTLTDIYGRRLKGSRQAEIAVRDRRPTLAHQLGFLTVPRSHPVLRMTHSNADSAEVMFVRVPDSLRIRAVSVAGGLPAVANLVRQVRDTFRVKIALPGAINEERVTEVPIPNELLAGHPGALLAVRARGLWKAEPAEHGPPRPGTLPTVRVLVDSSPGLSNNVALIQVTDLLAHAKVDAGWGAVFVTDIDDGGPVGGTSVTVYDPTDGVVATGMTNAAGVAELRTTPGWRPVLRERGNSYGYGQYWYGDRWSYYDAETRVVEVTRGNDRAFTVVTSSPYVQQPLAAGAADRSYDRVRLVRALLYTERPIYRPGERVYIGAIVREGWLGGLRRPPAGDSIRVKIAPPNPSGDEDLARDTVFRLDDYGAASDSFDLPRSTPLGYYDLVIEVVIDGKWRPLTSAGFRVAEYRAPEFRATLALDTTRAYFLGDTIRGRVAASYYFGAPMAKAAASWRAVTTPLWWFQVPRLPSGFVTGAAHAYQSTSVIPEVAETDTLDEGGNLSLAIPTEVGALTTPGHVEVQVMVEDLNRQTVTTTSSTTVHPSSYYVAVRDAGRSWYWTIGAPRTLEALVVRPDGRRVAGIPVRIAVVHHRAAWTSQGGAVPTMTWVADTVHRDSIVTRDSIVGYTYTPRADASHTVVFSIRDEAERPHTTAIHRYVTSSRATYAWGQNATSLQLRLLADTVEAGDSARVSILSPFSRAEAWVTVEREGIIAERRLTVTSGETTIAIPAAESFSPSAVVSVFLVNSGAAWRRDSLHQRMRAGRVTLAVSPSLKRLGVTVATEKPRYEPGDSARITVGVRDRRGQPVSGRVTLWAVDEAVLALDEFKVPDPFATFYAPRGSGLTFGTAGTTLASLARQSEPWGWRIAGRVSIGFATSSVQLSEVVATATASGGEMRVLLRSDFQTTPFFLAAVPIDSGIATVSVKLPDNLTTYRVIALATTRDSRFGSGDTPLMLTKPLLARAALPRFVRTGDSLTAGAVVTNQTGGARSVRVHAVGRAVGLDGTSTDTRTLASGASAEVRFGWRANANPDDTATFRFDVTADSFGDAVQTKVPVRAPYSPRFHTMTGLVHGGGTLRMLLPRGLDPARSMLTLQIGTTPIPVIRSAYRQLEAYPYQCTEQLTSTGEVIMAMLRLQRAGLIDSSVSPTPAELRRKLHVVVDEIARRQTDRGGFGYWTASAWTDVRLSTYAGFLLLNAKEFDVEVSERVLQRLAAFVRDPSSDENWQLDTTYGDRVTRARALANHLSNRLARVHYLRRVGDPDEDEEDELIAAELQMVWEDRVLLAVALSSRDDRSEARAVLDRAWRGVELLGKRVVLPDSASQSLWFRSPVRPAARLLRATVALHPRHPGLGALIEHVVRQGSAGTRWIWNTHDYAVASEALVDVVSWQRSAAVTGSVVFRSANPKARGRILLAAASTTRADSVATLDGLLERDGNWVALPIRVEAATDAAIYYSLTVREIPLTLPTKPDAQGITVERWYERWDDGRPVNRVQEGELVRGRLRITIPSDREYVAVEDLLPAGLEVVDLSLKTSSTLGPAESAASRAAAEAGDRGHRGSRRYGGWYGRWYDGWWSPWEHHEIRDDRVTYFARWLSRGTYTATYVARATTAGTFVRPPAHAEEMYNPALGGRSDGGKFIITPRK